MEKRICAKQDCKNNIPKYYVTEDGKKHNLQKRKFCLKCSPFGQHNTKDLNNFNDRGICKKCGNPTQKGSNRSKCHSCYLNERQIKISKKVYDLIGYDCWKCGYNKGVKSQSVLDFHHIHPENKLFNLTTRELVGNSWEKVWKEIQKCASLCCRCHREYHAGMITYKEMIKIYEERWKQIGP